MNTTSIGIRRTVGALLILPLFLGGAVAGCLNLTPTSPDDSKDDRPDQDEQGFAPSASPDFPVHFV